MVNFTKLQLQGKDTFNIHRIMNYTLENSLATDIGGGNYRVLVGYSITSDQGIKVSSNVSENTPISIVKGDREEVIEAASNSLPEVDEPIFGIVTDCVCRRLVLEEDERQKEIEGLRKKGNKVIGFYGMGEIGGEEYSTVNNNTVTGFVIGR